MSTSRHSDAVAARPEVKVLEDWMLLEEAAAELGVSRQGLHHIIWSGSAFNIDRDVRKVGLRGNTFVLRRSAVTRVAKTRAKAATAK